MQEYDLMVIGAGPAGATAAAEAASSGLKVLLIEKESLPRHKTCGGGMPMVVQNCIKDLAPFAFIESDVKYMRLTKDFKDPHLKNINPPGYEKDISIWMVQRAVFDNALAERAVKLGAVLKDNMQVKDIFKEEDYIVVKCDSFSAKAKHLIGADGANGIVGRKFSLRKDAPKAIAIEIEFPYSWREDKPNLQKDYLHLDVGCINGGYAWIFPKEDHLNIGAGLFNLSTLSKTERKEIPTKLKKAIYDYLEMFDIEYDESTFNYFAHPLPIWNGKEDLNTKDGRVLLAGDAAGLISPMFGDGIYHAITSGKLAVKTIVENKTKDYTKVIYKEIGNNFDSSSMLAKAFYKYTDFIYSHGMKKDYSARVAAELLCGTISFDSIKKRVYSKLANSIPGIKIG